jgi:hypothetical protein
VPKRTALAAASQQLKAEAPPMTGTQAATGVAQLSVPQEQQTLALHEQVGDLERQWQ